MTHVRLPLGEPRSERWSVCISLSLPGIGRVTRGTLPVGHPINNRPAALMRTCLRRSLATGLGFRRQLPLAPRCYAFLPGCVGRERKADRLFSLAKRICHSGSQKSTHPPFFLFYFFFKKVFIAFLGVSRHGGLKNSEKTFLEIFWS